MTTTPTPTPTATVGVPPAVRRGVLAALPLLCAYVPFALVIGSLTSEHGGWMAGWVAGWLIFGGSAHLAAVRTLTTAGPVVAIMTGLLINARLVVYSASLARRWAGQPRWFRIAAAALIIDPTWAIAESDAEYGADPRAQRQFFIAAGLALGASWSTAIAVGALMGARLDTHDLQIAIPLCLLGLLGAGLRTAGARSVIVAAAVVGLVGAHWPSGTGVLVAVGAGCAVGLVHERGRAR